MLSYQTRLELAERKREELVRDETQRLINDPDSGFCPWTVDNFREGMAESLDAHVECSRIALGADSASRTNAPEYIGQLLCKAIYAYWRTKAEAEVGRTTPSAAEIEGE